MINHRNKHESKHATNKKQYEQEYAKELQENNSDNFNCKKILETKLGKLEEEPSWSQHKRMNHPRDKIIFLQIWVVTKNNDRDFFMKSWKIRFGAESPQHENK